jgi:hypothetical protein
MARRRTTLAHLAAALALAAGGCGFGNSTPDSEIVKALDLKPVGQRYEIGGDPFCVVAELLNDGDEVDQASGDQGQEFLIASPDGEIGVLALRPFAPDCTRRAKDDLRRLAKKSD